MTSSRLARIVAFPGKSMAGTHVLRSFSGLLIALSGLQVAVAGELAVRVVGVNGQPVPNIVVFVKQAGITLDVGRKPASAVMDQRDVRFVPHILIVEKGSSVEFPNSDTTAHHVYSFSRPNNFVLPLYKGRPPGPVTLDHDGVVTLGCNIHDGMLGYIVVVDTNLFGLTDGSGEISISVDDNASNYEVSIWSPRIKDTKDPMVQSVSTVTGDGVTFKLQKSLRPAHVEDTGSVKWDEY